MEKYRQSLTDRVQVKRDYTSGVQQNKVDPFGDSQVALVQAQFVSKERETFFDEAYGSILADLFMAWLQTAPHATKERDFLYASAMALGSVKNKMVQIENYGKNAAFMNKQKEAINE